MEIEENRDMVVRDDTKLTVEEIKANVQLIQQVMEGVMKEDHHYGKIPGCGDKPTLLKPGAEKLLVTFRLGPEPIVTDLSGPDIIRYRVETRIMHIPTGQYVCSGIGECSSDEEKYKWKKAVCDEEFDETPEDRKRKKWKRNYKNNSNYQEKQIRTNPADIANTVLKMAKKRSLVDGTLTATAASDIFAQDLEDMHPQSNGKTKPNMQPPQSKSEAEQPSSKTGEEKKKITLLQSGCMRISVGKKLPIWSSTMKSVNCWGSKD